MPSREWYRMAAREGTWSPSARRRSRELRNRMELQERQMEPVRGQWLSLIDICRSRLQQNKLTDTALHTVDMHALHTEMSCTDATVALHTVEMHVLHPA